MISRKSMQALVLATAGVLFMGAKCGSNNTGTNDNTGASGSRTSGAQDQGTSGTTAPNSGTTNPNAPSGTSGTGGTNSNAP